LVRDAGPKYPAVAKVNFRLIFTVAAIGIVLLVALCAVGIGYMVAASHAIGHFAPIGDPTNFKHK
jgi:hypothetical protein